MEFKNLKQSLKTNVQNSYILKGDDQFLKTSALNNLIKASGVNEFQDLNILVFSTENINEINVINALNTMPFMTEKKLIIIKEYENKKNEKLVKALAEYLKSPNEFSMLVIVENDETSLQELERYISVVVDCVKLDFDYIVGYVMTVLKQNNFSMDSQSIRLLVELSNQDMSKIDLDLKKLIALKYNEKVITSEDVKNNVTKTLEYQIYELTEALFKKESLKTLMIVEDIVKNKKNINTILPLIMNNIRRLFFVKVSTTSSNQELANLLQIKEFAVKKQKELVINYGATFLKQALEKSSEIDYKIKSGQIDIVSGIYELVFYILSR